MESRPLALVIDDEPDIRDLLEITLSRMDIEVQAAADCAEARDALDRQSFDLCFTDMRLPDGDGIDLVRYIADVQPGLPVAVITAHGNMQAAVESLKAGAFDFVSKPVDLNLLRNLVGTALKLSVPKAGKKTKRPRERLLGESGAMEQVRKSIAKLARSQAPVFISGESGVGKELAARLIHDLGPRSEGPFVPVNCGAIPTELMESELFGYKKGSFTGANADKEGLFQTSHNGTLFLDEVADLPLHMQVKLLRVIQERSVRPVGASAEVPVDVRVLSASHKNLMELVESGAFRQDLYYRINVIELNLPSLRERPEDIPELAAHCLARIAETWGKPPPRLSADAQNALKNYSFPGNVRELENILERAMTLCDEDSISASDLQLPDAPATSIVPELTDDSVPLEQLMDHVERDAILKALEETRYNKTAAAKKLGITFRALRYRLKKLNLE